MPRIQRSRESRIGGGARCSRRHSLRNSKIVAAESRASVSAISIDDFVMSAAAPRLDAVTADSVIGLQRFEREAELLFHCSGQKPALAVLLPVCRLHHLCDASSIGLAQQAEHALLLGDTLATWFFGLNLLGLHLGRQNFILILDGSLNGVITATQLRAARALLGLDQRALAELSGLSVPTIQRMEGSEALIRGNVDSLMKLVAALDASGIELIGEGAASSSGGRGYA
jgi:hypothetical protein